MEWEWHLPINPPGSYLAEGDVMIDHVDINNWWEDTDYVFEPRLHDGVRQISAFRMALDDEAPEIDAVYDCD